MEIDAGVKILAPASSLAGSKAATSAASQAGKSIVLPPIEAKAAPELVEFKRSDIDRAVADLQKFIDGLARELSFRIDESIDRSVITVRDSNSGQLVRQIPAEEVVEIARQIKQDLDVKRAGMLLRGQA